VLEQAEPATIGQFLDFGFVDPAIRAQWQVQTDEGPRLAEVTKGGKLPELNGTNARLREIVAAQRKG